jgi:hypothetical protein
MKLCKLLLSVAGATVLLGALVGIASARSFSTSSQTLRETFREVGFTGNFGTITCEATLEGSLHTRTIAKVAGSLIGYVTRATQGGCSAFEVTFLTETLPWHVRYLGFQGTLPNITQIRTNVIGLAFLIRESGGITCLARSTATEPATRLYSIAAGGVLTGVELGGSIRTGAECFGTSLALTGRSSSLTTLGTATSITVTLI